ncbi:hypothetical protein FKW77_004954 [Venturia effusa]|uniref:Uncharacterized protein n=1 Tax=Venturia effusa TaxID=50376 RepID=A0A517LIN3_9PEZI|nr:hypothetical protein FKW77_004954 [Venturia effusa]
MPPINTDNKGACAFMSVPLTGVQAMYSINADVRSFGDSCDDTTEDFDKPGSIQPATLIFENLMGRAPDGLGAHDFALCWRLEGKDPFHRPLLEAGLGASPPGLTIPGQVSLTTLSAEATKDDSATPLPISTTVASDQIDRETPDDMVLSLMNVGSWGDDMLG